jgi:hypothetical protein
VANKKYLMHTNFGNNSQRLNGPGGLEPKWVQVQKLQSLAVRLSHKFPCKHRTMVSNSAPRANLEFELNKGIKICSSGITKGAVELLHIVSGYRSVGYNDLSKCRLPIA